jgi:hypothetical protein
VSGRSGAHGWPRRWRFSVSLVGSRGGVQANNRAEVRANVRASRGENRAAWSQEEAKWSGASSGNAHAQDKAVPTR